MNDPHIADQEQVLVLAPQPVDEALGRALSEVVGADCVVCSDADELARRVDENTGALVITEEALAGGMRPLIESLQRQPSWSDVPILVLLDRAVPSGGRVIDLLGNVMILERPVQAATLVSALRSSIRARRRQYDLRSRMEALRQSEERFRFLADNIPASVWVAAPDGSLRYANDKWYDYAGIARDDTRQWPLIVLHPEDRDLFLQRWAQALSRGEDFEIEVRCRRHDGVYRWFVVSASPLKGGNGEIVSWFGVTTDIHEQKQAERSARFLADASAALSEITDYRSTLRRIAGLAVPDFADWCAVDMLKDGGALHRLAVMHVDPARVPLAFELNRRYPQRREVSFIWRAIDTLQSQMEVYSDEALAALARDEGELELLRALGTRSAIAVPLCCRGSVLGVITFVCAGTERAYTSHEQRIAEYLARRAAVAIDNATLYRELQDAHRRKDEFLATLAHELRNPLAPIRNALQVMRLTEDRDTVLQAQAIMERQLEQMVRLIDDLLEVSRITRGQFSLRTERVDLATVIGNAVDTARPLIEAAGHKLIVKLPPQPVWLEADPVRLAQVFSNLLNNAAKYMERGGTIWLTAEQRDGDVLVSVRDTGMGIPAESLPRIFDIFMQVDQSPVKAQGGLGIGLTLVKRLVEMHQGSVEARSDGPGKGSAFTVTLPVAAEPAAEAAAAAQDAVSSGRHRILVADDNADVAESLAMMLRLMGNEVRTVSDGTQAIEQTTAFAPEMIMLDIGMPGIDGYETARRIRAQHWDKPLILVALTGWGQEEDRRRSLAAGFDHHFTKPMSPADLERLVSRLPQPASADAEAQLNIEL